MDIIIHRQLENHLKLDTSVLLLMINYLQGIGPVKIFGLEKEGQNNQVLKIEKVNTDAKEKV